MSQREEKRAKFSAEESQKKFPVMILAVVLLLAGAATYWFVASPGGSGQFVTAENGKVSIQLSEVTDGKAHYYSYRAGSSEVDFFLLKSRDGTVRAALDACDVCYKSGKGYRQEGDFMVCNNCNQKFQSDMINVIKGGCNPAPLTRTVENGQVVLLERELQAGQRYFPTQG